VFFLAINIFDLQDNVFTLPRLVKIHSGVLDALENAMASGKFRAVTLWHNETSLTGIASH
jgi:hypothetical protein